MSFHYHEVPHSKQQDPAPFEMFTTQETLQKYYQIFNHGSIIVVPKNRNPLCLARWMPFEDMPQETKMGWNTFAKFLIGRTSFLDKVKINGPQVAGQMWANGWRKSSVQESFVQYSSFNALAKKNRKQEYNEEEEKESIIWAGEFLASQLKQFAPEVFKDFQDLLVGNNLPSFSQMTYQEGSYRPMDFTSFLTFTMQDFANKPHKDHDLNQWTLVGWIPVFNPLDSGYHEQISTLADHEFDMTGGQFTFCEMQVALDFTRFCGICLCVFRLTEFLHQTLHGQSPSKKYTRIGFSCQINERLAHAVDAYLHGRCRFDYIGDQADHIQSAMNKCEKICK